MQRCKVVPVVKRILAISALCALGACGEQRPTEPGGPTASSLLDEPTSSSPALIECPSKETLTESALVGSLGGTVSIGGTKVVFPAGALPGLTTVTLTIPASKYVEVDIETSGPKQFPANALPVVTIDYSRCTRTDILSKPITAWYIDSETKALIDPMPSVDDKLARAVTFSTNHFSGYAIAF